MTEPGGGHRRSTRARHRVAWGLLDQVVSSASNVVVLVLAARALPASGFGVFALGMASIIVAAGIGRGVASDPLATAHAADEPLAQRHAIRSGAAVVLWPSIVIAAAVAVLALPLEDARTVLWAIALVLPGLLLQDYIRYALIVRRQAQLACLNDTFWLLVQVPALLLVTASDGGPAALLLAWGTSGCAAAVLGLAQLRLLPARPTAARAWLGDHRELWPYYVLDNLVHQVSAVGILSGIAIVASTADVGGVRAAMTVYAPLTLLSRGILGVAVPELARRHSRGEEIKLITLQLASGLALLGLLCAALTPLIPDSAGRALLGDSWALADPVLLLAGAVPIVGLFSSGIVIGVRAIGAARHGLNARILAAAIVMAAATLGGWWDGIHGVFVMLAITAPIQMAVWYRLLVTAHAPPSSDQPELMELTALPEPSDDGTPVS